jgi:hypothetical protein
MIMRHTSARLRKYQVRTLPNQPHLQPKKAITETFVQLGNDLITRLALAGLVNFGLPFGKYRHGIALRPPRPQIV